MFSLYFPFQIKFTTPFVPTQLRIGTAVADYHWANLLGKKLSQPYAYRGVENSVYSAQISRFQTVYDLLN